MRKQTRESRCHRGQGRKEFQDKEWLSVSNITGKVTGFSNQEVTVTLCKGNFRRMVRKGSQYVLKQKRIPTAVGGGKNEGEMRAEHS